DGITMIRLGDFDGDGDEDIIKSGGSNVAFMQYINSAEDGTFDDAIVYYETGSPITVLDLVLADMDQDNDLDIVIAKKISGSYIIEIYYNLDGMGGFSVNPEFVYANPFPGAAFKLAVGDFDLNGYNDVTISSGSGVDILYQNISTQPWTTQPLDPVIQGGSVIVADFDNDGSLDLITSDNGSPSFFTWFENLGGVGNFETHNIPTELEYIFGPKNFQLGDFDNDGDTDVTLNNWTSDYSYNDGAFLLKNNLSTDDTFNDLIRIPGHVDGYTYPIATDLNGDGYNDLLIGSTLSGKVFWCENLGIAGEFSEPQNLFPDEFITRVIFEDLDGDGDRDVIAAASPEELVWFENLSTTTVAFGPKQVLANNTFPELIAAGDFDNDGDLDIGAQRATDEAILWYEQTSPATFSSHLVAAGSDHFQIIDFKDMDNDGALDCVYRDIVNNDNHLRYFKMQSGGSFTSHLIIEDGIYALAIGDIDDDLDNDIIYRAGDEFRLLLNDAGDFDDYLIANNANSLRGIKIGDIDGDGKKDFYAGRGWCKQLVGPTNFSELLILDADGKGRVELADLTGNGILDFICHVDSDELVWAENQINEGAFIEGRVTVDAISNCTFDTEEDTLGIYGWLLEFSGNTETLYTSTNPNGYYSAFIPDSGNYNAHLALPNNYWGTCFNDSLLTGVGPGSITPLDFYVPIEYDCPLMQINIGFSPLRPCIDGSYIVHYCNEGTIEADDASVEVLLDENLIFNSANFPFTETDSSYLFEVGSVAAGECGTIVMSVTPDCSIVDVGDIVCATTYVTPDSLCTPLDSLWDGSTITVNGTCLNDSIHFELENIGIGNMSEARQFRIEIVNEDIVLLIVADTFELEVGEMKSVVVPAEMNALRLEADQDIAHPVSSTAAALVTECGSVSLTANLFPLNIADPFSEVICRNITGSYDPNIKTVIPKGYGSENFIDRSWELSYTVQFQNTGNDTAFTVVILDPISEHLDLSTLKVKGASHPFTWELNTERELIFTFSNILLPDSTTNEAASHGFVEYSLMPVPEIDFGTQIRNKAAIYFDFNDPIITNETSQTIRTPIFATSEHINVCAGDVFMDVEISEDQLIVDSLMTAEGLYMDFFHLHVFGNEVTIIDTTVQQGTFYNSILITNDTIVEVLLQDVYGCDSLIISNVMSQVVGVDEIADEYGIQLYPQPSNDLVYLSWNTEVGIPTGYQIVDAKGSVVQELAMGTYEIESPQVINVKALLDGVYWLRLEYDNQVVYKRIVKM
ncbi:MAG: FG-GAP-like repeat-containing protein, partial [Saprospiraceae bacterium]